MSRSILIEMIQIAMTQVGRLRMIQWSLLLAITAAVLSAQSGYAVLNGRVQDSSGGVVPNVPVTARNVLTDVVLNSVSNSEGYYSFLNLIPGTYTLTARQQGFKNLERTGVVLQVGDRLEVNLALQVGDSSQQVTVTEQALLLRTDDAQSGMVVDNKRIQELPAYDRNVLAFAQLVANVNGTDEQAGQTTNFRINGGRSAQAEYYVDGVPVTTVFHDNVFGGAIGGPVAIPKLYNGRDKTFFFFNYEGTRHVSGSSATLAGVPTALEREGNFGQTLIGNGVPVMVYDPSSGVTTAGGDVIRQPYPGNIVPKSKLDPLSVAYLRYYPMPNTAPLPGSTDANNYVGNSLNPQSDGRWTGRLDQNWNSMQSTHFTITFDQNQNLTPGWLSPLQYGTVASGTSYSTSLNHVWTMTPSTILEFRAGVIRISTFSVQRCSTVLPLFRSRGAEIHPDSK